MSRHNSKENKILTRIEKVLALARNNANDQEAQSALLMAQSLMAKYNIRESSLPGEQKRLIEKIITEHTSKSAWKLNLAALIAKNFRCKCFLTKAPSEHFHKLGFIGFEEDLFIALDTFEFAQEALTKSWNRYKSAVNAGGAKSDFASGYTLGLKHKFDEQVEKNGWGLIVQPSAEMLDMADKMGSYNHRNRAAISVKSAAFSSGFIEGKRFRYTARKKLDK